jgi:hypothetical protein
MSTPNLSNAADQVVTMGSAITDITFSNSGGAISSCTVAPTLPAGLSINSATCAISGTPTKVKAATLYTVTATANAPGRTATATVGLAIFMTPTTLTAVATGVPNEIMLSWTRVTDATAYRLYQTTDATFVQAGNSDPSQFSVYSPAATSIDTKPAGSVGATVQLEIAPPELLKVMSVMAEPIVTTWSAAFERLGVDICIIIARNAVNMPALAVLIGATRVINNRMRIKLVLKGVEFIKTPLCFFKIILYLTFQDKFFKFI